MNEMIPTQCHNCGKEDCQDGEPVGEDEFREGLVVKQNNLDNDYLQDYFGDEDYGTGRVIKVQDEYVFIECIKPGVNGEEFNSTDEDPKTFRNVPTFIFSCEEYSNSM